MSLKNPGPKLFFSRFGGEQPIPQEFIAAMGRHEEVQAVPNEVEPEELSDTIVASEVKTNREGERVRSTVKKDAGNIGPLHFVHVNDQGQPVQVSRTMMLTAYAVDNPAIPTATSTPADQDLGNGWTIREVGVAGTYVDETFTPGVFDPALLEKRRDDTVPERFKATVPAITTKHVTTGTAVAPTLTTGDLYRSERQVTVSTKEVTITNRDISSLPTLEGQKYDEELNVLIPYTEQVVAAGSAIGDASTEVSPLGGGLDLVTVYDLTAIASAFASFQLVFPGKANLDLPDVLTALDLLNETHEGMGDSTTPFFLGYWDNSGSYSVTPAGTSQGSQSVIPELIPTIVPTYGNRKSTTRLVFLLPMPVTSAAVLAKIAAILGTSVSDWPDFNPKPVHAVLTGRQISLQVHATYHIQDGGSATSDEHGESFVRGYSTEVGMIVKTKEISPTIHGDLSSGLDPYTIASFDLTADAYYDSETQTTPELSTGITVTGAGATSGITTIPSTGKRLLDSNGSPYRFNHAMVHAEVFDFATLH